MFAASPSSLRKRAEGMRESADRCRARAAQARLIPTAFWQTKADEAEALARRCIEAAEKLDACADRATARGLPFPLNLIGA